MKDPNQAIQDLTKTVLDTQTDMQTQFDKFDVKFAQVDARFEQVEFRMTRLENNQQQVLSDLRELKTKTDRVFDVLDGIASRITDDDTERVSLSAQVTRHEDWIVKAAPVIGVEYTPGT